MEEKLPTLILNKLHILGFLEKYSIFEGVDFEISKIFKLFKGLVVIYDLGLSPNTRRTSLAYIRCGILILFLILNIIKFLRFCAFANK